MQPHPTAPSFEATFVDPFDRTAQHLHSFNNNDLAFNQRQAEIADMLKKKLGPEYVSTRSGPSGGGKLTYLEGWKAIDLANEVFGFDGWFTELRHLQVDFIDDIPETAPQRYNIGVSATVRVWLKGGGMHEDIGYGKAENVKSKADGLDKCKKEAMTDGLKRSLRSFGALLGNCMYDKAYTSEIGKVKPVKPKFLVSELHRPDNSPRLNALSAVTAAAATAAAAAASTSKVPQPPNPNAHRPTAFGNATANAGVTLTKSPTNPYANSNTNGNTKSNIVPPLQPQVPPRHNRPPQAPLNATSSTSNKPNPNPTATTTTTTTMSSEDDEFVGGTVGSGGMGENYGAGLEDEFEFGLGEGEFDGEREGEREDEEEDEYGLGNEIGADDSGLAEVLGLENRKPASKPAPPTSVQPPQVQAAPPPRPQPQPQPQAQSSLSVPTGGVGPQHRTRSVEEQARAKTEAKARLAQRQKALAEAQQQQQQQQQQQASKAPSPPFANGKTNATTSPTATSNSASTTATTSATNSATIRKMPTRAAQISPPKRTISAPVVPVQAGGVASINIAGPNSRAGGGTGIGTSGASGGGGGGGIGMGLGFVNARGIKRGLDEDIPIPPLQRQLTSPIALRNRNQAGSSGNGPRASPGVVRHPLGELELSPKGEFKRPRV